MKFSPVILLTTFLGLTAASPARTAAKLHTEEADLEMFKLYENGTLPTITEPAQAKTGSKRDAFAEFDQALEANGISKRQGLPSNLDQCWNWICLKDDWQQTEGWLQTFYTLYGNRWGYDPMTLNYQESRGTRCNGFEFVVSYRGWGSMREHGDGRRGTIYRPLPGGKKASRCVTSRDVHSYWMIGFFEFLASNHKKGSGS
ncbi:hypothetical protein ABW19_dt0205374 [Dactylella cylindrospora]|nr:hypothetical protein ABW19_dt0205374 [Dactylella cylindrospora]